MKNYFNKLHYETDLALEDRLILPFLLVFSCFYALISKIRNFFYRSGLLKQNKLKAFVISVGNLTTGGTGKTPITVEIANYISDKLQKNIAVLSRGYGGKLSVSDVNIISNGKNIFYSAHMSGDEPYWMAVNSKNVPIITGKNRYESGLKAMEEFNSEILILDDGFQHLKLKRDLNLLVIDCNLKFGNGYLLPAGPLRESLAEIKRADKIILVNKKSLDNSSKQICENFAKNLENTYKKPVFCCNFTNKGIFCIKTSQELALNSTVFAFAGIARPEYFFEYLSQTGHNLVKTRVFNDHHLYTKDDIQNIIREAKMIGANAIVTTEKDAVKLKALLEETSFGLDFYALKLGIDLDLEKLLEVAVSPNLCPRPKH
ncbi:MAG: tetraacyldisaccharide 4'-kinase [Candidatus Gastranaerophilaceae bacterium]|jgi:tetraacyldisaccharide 4'-kinase